MWLVKITAPEYAPCPQERRQIMPVAFLGDEQVRAYGPRLVAHHGQSQRNAR